MNDQAFELLMSKLKTIEKSVASLDQKFEVHKIITNKEIVGLKLKTAKLIVLATIFGFSGSQLDKVIFKNEKQKLIKQQIQED